MRFTVLSSVQAWTLLGVTVLVVIALYLLRPQPARFVMPSTLLWRRVVERRQKRRERLRWLLSLLLSLAIARSRPGSGHG